MNEKLSRAFKKITDADPPLELEDKILHKISLIKEGRVRRKLLLSYVGFATSFSALIYAGTVFGSLILRSEFWNLANLLFTDMGIIAGHWTDFLFSLLETFPAVYLVAMIIPVFVFLISASCYFNAVNANAHRHKLI
ncbi:MAG: hypothetical protein WC858_05595 [Parcubacteria group bacterium]|jgi:hypothetical protein